MKDMDIVHRDLKPENILVKWNGDEGKKVFKVADFGISRYLNTDVVDVANLTKEYTNGTIIGTPLYMAPEVILGKPYGHKVDVFSYGLVVYEAATGRHLFGDKLVSRLALLNSVMPISKRGRKQDFCMGAGGSFMDP